MFEGPVTGNIPEVLDNGEVTDGTHVTAGQLALALTPYAQVTELAVNTAASGNNAAAIQPWTPGSPLPARHGLPSWCTCPRPTTSTTHCTAASRETRAVTLDYSHLTSVLWGVLGLHGVEQLQRSARRPWQSPSSPGCRTSP